MIKTLNKMLDKGTKIVSFDYDGERRNVLVGANGAILGQPTWGKQINRALRIHRGSTYLVGIDNNDQHIFKTFNVNKIVNPSF